MKRASKVKIIAATAVLSVAVILPFQKGYAIIPTTDVLVYTQLLQQGFTLIEQLTTLKRQFDVAKDQLENMRGVSGIGQSVTAQLDASRDKLFALKPPSDLFKEPLYTVNEIFKKDSKAKENYKLRGEYLKSNIEQVNKMYTVLLERKSTLNSLKSKISTAETNKKILDLSARIAAENGLLQNDIALINMLEMSMTLSTQAITYNEAGRAMSNLKDVKHVK